MGVFFFSFNFVMHFIYKTNLHITECSLIGFFSTCVHTDSYFSHTNSIGCTLFFFFFLLSLVDVACFIH